MSGLRKLVSMRAALLSSAYFGDLLAGESWRAWRILLTAAVGEALTEDERVVFKAVTDRDREPLEPVEEFWAVVGRRGGKSRATAVLAAYLAACVDHRHALAVGERGVLPILAASTTQAASAFNFVSGIFAAAPNLRELVQNETADTISLASGVDITIRPASYRTLRGITAIGGIGDELASWRSDDSANPDSEIIRALRPSVATTGGMLAFISSPHAKRGELYATFKRHFGPAGHPLILVAKAPSRTMNPSLSQRVVDRAYEEDPEGAAAEYGGEFRGDISAFVSREAVDGASFSGRLELPPITGFEYVGFVDPSGGSADSMTLAIAHSEDAKDGTGPIAVLDAIREVRPPFSPDSVVGEFVDLLRSYELSEVVGDRWGGNFVREQFESRGVKYTPSERPKSDIYRELLPLMNSGRTELLDHPRLAAQLIGLERRTARGGRDSIDHTPGGHDDVANAAAGALVLAAGVGSDRFNGREFVAAWGGGEMNRFINRLRGTW